MNILITGATGWAPQTTITQGLVQTIKYLKKGENQWQQIAKQKLQS